MTGVDKKICLDKKAAALPGRVRALAMYEPPVLVDASRKAPPADYRQRVDTMLAEGRNGDVVGFFMTKIVGAPAFVPLIMPLVPAWSKLKAVAPTLRYDLTVLGDSLRGMDLPEELRKTLAAIEAPTLVADGGKSPAWMHNGVRAVADAVGQVTRLTLPKQTHQVKPEVLAPALVDFFTRASAAGAA